MARKSARKHKILHPLTLDPEVRARELASLSEFLGKPITQDRFNKWLGVSIGRDEPSRRHGLGLDRMAALTRQAPRFPPGRRIQDHSQIPDDRVLRSRRRNLTTRWRNGVTTTPLVVSDGPHDETSYRVTFFGRVPLLWVNRVEATFSSVPWEHPLHQARFLNILGSPRDFVNINSKVTVLAKMRVESGFVRAVG